MKRIKINWFVLIAGTLMAAAIVKEFRAQLSVDRREVRLQQEHIQLVRVDELREMLANDKATRQFVFIYASWCSVCHQVMPYALQALEGKPDISVYMVSLDQRMESLATYLIKSKLAGRYTPYLINPGQMQQLTALITEHGGSFDGGIPYLLLLKNGEREIDSGGNKISSVIQVLAQ